MIDKNKAMSRKKLSLTKSLGSVSSEVKDWGNDPFVLKSVEKARKTIEKYGLPKEWVEEAKKINEAKGNNKGEN